MSTVQQTLTVSPTLAESRNAARAIRRLALRVVPALVVTLACVALIVLGVPREVAVLVAGLGLVSVFVALVGLIAAAVTVAVVTEPEPQEIFDIR